MAYKKLRSTDPIVIENIMVILYGDPGTGKSSLGFTAEAPENHNWDKGLGRVVNRGESMSFDTWQDCLDYIDSEEFKKDVSTGKIKTLINDTAGTLLDNYLKKHVINIGGKGVVDAFGGLGLKGYGIVKDSFERYYNKCLENKVDMVFICHTKTEDDGERKRFFPQMTGGSREILIQKADLIGYMEMVGDKITIDFNPTDRHFGKNCANIPKTNVPHYKEIEYHTFLANILTTTKKHINRLSEAQAAALKVVEEFRNKVIACETIPALEQLRPEIDALNDNYKTQVYYFYSKAFAELWAVQNIDVENTKTPDQFKELSAKIGALPKEITGELREIFSKLLKAAGLKYDKVSGKFEPITVTPTPAEKTKANETAVKTETAKEIVIHDESWFLERIGKRVNYTNDGKTVEALVESENTAYHMYGVMQKIKKGEFADLEPAKSDAAVPA